VLDQIRADIRWALRRLRTSLGYAIVSVVTLGLGIGASTAIFSTVDAVLIESLPYRDPSTLVQIWESSPARNLPTFGVAPGNFDDWRARASSFSELAASRPRRMILTQGDTDPERVPGEEVSTNYFQSLGMRMHLGRGLTAADSLAAAGRSAVLGYTLWMRRFGGDSAVIGKSITLDGAPFTVVGLASANVPAQVQLWTPLRLPPFFQANRDAHTLSVIGRLAPGRTIQSARLELAGMYTQFASAFPASNKDWTVALVPLLDQVVGQLRPALLALMAAVLFLLLIACANVANLTLARGYARAREVALRGAIGASRARIAAQLLTENVVVALGGGVLGVGIAAFGVTLLRRLAPADLPRLDNVGVDGRVLAFGIVASLATAIIFGLLPALQISRTDPASVLREEGRASATKRARTIQRSLVVAQIAFAMLLLTGATLLFRSFVSLANRPLGFDTDRIATGQLTLPRGSYGRKVDQSRYADALLEQLQAAPGVESAAIARATPGTRGTSIMYFSIQNVPDPDAGGRPTAYFVPASVGYFKTLGVRLTAGRAFTDADRADAAPVAVVDELLVRRFLGRRDPLTQHVLLADDSVPRRIVGVVSTVRLGGINADEQPTTYVPFSQEPGVGTDLSVFVRGREAPPLRSLRNSVRTVDATVPLYDTQPLAARIRASVAPTRFYAVIASVFAVIAVTLGAIGIYGLLTDAVIRQRRELGIRVALGASARTVVGSVVGDAVRLAAVGVGIGLLASLGTGRWLRALLVDIGERDPLALGGAAAVFTVVALGAALPPAIRAVRVDPIEALRSD
jgi:putative ABC transport system permease protein